MTDTRPRPSTNASGYSLLEVMVSSLITLVVMGAMYAGIEQTEVFWESYSGQMDMRQRARAAIDQMSDEMRMVGYDIGNVDEVLIQAEDFAIQFVADIDDGDDTGVCDSLTEGTDNGGVERITYYYDENTSSLMRTIDCWDGTAWAVDDTPITMLEDIGPTIPIFRFFDFTGTQVPLGGGALDTETRSSVRAVAITLDLEDLNTNQFVGDDHTNLVLETQVRLHNLERPVSDDD